MTSSVVYSISADMSRLSKALNASPVVADMARLSKTLNASPFFDDLSRASKALYSSSAVANMARLSKTLNTSPFFDDLSRASRALYSSSVVADMARLSKALDTSPLFDGLNRASKALYASSVVADMTRLSKTLSTSPFTAELNRVSRATTALEQVSKLEFPTYGLIGETTQHFDANIRTRAHRPAIHSRSVKTINETPDYGDNPESNHFVQNDRGTTGLLITPDSGNSLSIQVGFSVSLGSIPIPQAIEAINPEVTSDPQYWRILVTLEQHLRSFVQRSLKKSVGNNWIRQRVPEDVRKNWATRQNEDRVLSKPVYELIQYADFMDLEKIINRNDNWQEVFKHVFRNRDDIRVTFARLHPIRNAIAHGRPLDSDDTLSLINEAARIFHSLCLKELH